MNSLTLEPKDGYWRINEKALSICSPEKQAIFETHLKMKKFKSPIVEREIHTFHNRKAEIKAMNYKFKNLYSDHLKDYPNIEELIFDPKNEEITN